MNRAWSKWLITFAQRCNAVATEFVRYHQHEEEPVIGADVLYRYCPHCNRFWLAEEPAPKVRERELTHRKRIA